MTSQVRKLVTALEKAKKRNPNRKPSFVFVNLKEWLPPAYPEHLAVEVDEAAGTFKTKSDQVCPIVCHMIAYVAPACSQGRSMDWASWLIAWDGYVIGAAVAGQLSHKEAQQYKAVVTEVCVACWPFNRNVLSIVTRLQPWEQPRVALLL